MEYEFVDFQQSDVKSGANLIASGKKMWWSGRTFMEKVLLIACTFGCLICIGLVISLCLVLVVNHEKVRSSEVRTVADDVCTAKTCIQESARILSRMNNKTDPYVFIHRRLAVLEYFVDFFRRCDDFYEFACGDFLRVSCDCISMTPPPNTKFVFIN